MEAMLAGLGNRIFLMNNVHDDGPIVFETRWVMSYLRGPLTRDQIKTLMVPANRRHLLPRSPRQNRFLGHSVQRFHLGLRKSSFRLERQVQSFISRGLSVLRRFDSRMRNSVSSRPATSSCKRLFPIGISGAQWIEVSDVDSS